MDEYGSMSKNKSMNKGEIVMPLSEKFSIKAISRALEKGIEKLEKVKHILDKIKESGRYNISNIVLSGQKGRIDFNFYWFKLYVRFELIAREASNTGRPNHYYFEYKLIWGRYEKDENGMEKEFDIINDNFISNSSRGLLFIWGNYHPELEDIDDCVVVIDRIILECLPDALVHMDK